MLKNSVFQICLMRKTSQRVCSCCSVAAAAVANPALSLFKCCIPNMTSVSVLFITVEGSGCFVPPPSPMLYFLATSKCTGQGGVHLQVHAAGQCSECTSPSRAVSWLLEELHRNSEISCQLSGTSGWCATVCAQMPSFSSSQEWDQSQVDEIWQEPRQLHPQVRESWYIP